MKKNKINLVIEFLSPSLILSYFLIHNIFLVLIGITLSLYLININFFISLKKSVNKNLSIKNELKDSIRINKMIKTNCIDMKSSKKASKLSLAEAIEELGYIPKQDKNDDSNAA